MRDLFDGAYYIKAKQEFQAETAEKDGAPLFRKRFYLNKVSKAKVLVQGLGLAHFYLNGTPITNDLFLSPVSDYDKILWYNVYDVTSLLREGENVFSVICGNGFFNECFETQFGYDKASWRDQPKFLLNLVADGTSVLRSDTGWKVNTDSFVTYNQYRSGERYDARKYDERWTLPEFDDSEWKAAVRDDRPPKGTLLECQCPPIRALERFRPVSIRRNKRGYLVDFGQNISGYVQLQFCGTKGAEIVLRHAEEIDENNELRILNLDMLYPQVEFQTERIRCSGKPGVYTPYFVYHGFRYVEVCGYEGDLTEEKISAVFVHQDLKRRSEFSCGSEMLNRMERAARYSVYSNAFYTITDCPTREKLGWTNDLQASAEQLFFHYEIESLLEKFLTDMRVEIGEDGSFPAIIPTNGWGRHNGPVADGAFFEIPYLFYVHAGNPEPLQQNRPYFDRYLRYLKQRIANKAGVLGDWLGNRNNLEIPFDFIERYYLIHLTKITALAERLCGNREAEQALKREAEDLLAAFQKDYLEENGRCRIDQQTAVAVLIREGMAERTEPLKEQLTEIVRRDGYGLKCGMFGLQFLPDALSMCGRSDLAYRMITTSEPGYATWFRHGATTLWELWDGVDTHSHNHHMFSCVVGWFFKWLLGIQPQEAGPGYSQVRFRPSFLREVGFARGSVRTPKGTISTEWRIEGNRVTYRVVIPEGITGVFEEERLKAGENVFLREI